MIIDWLISWWRQWWWGIDPRGPDGPDEETAASQRNPESRPAATSKD